MASNSGSGPAASASASASSVTTIRRRRCSSPVRSPPASTPATRSPASTAVCDRTGEGRRQLAQDAARHLAVAREGRAHDRRAAGRGRVAHDLAQQPGLPDAGFARHEQHPALPRSRAVPVERANASDSSRPTRTGHTWSLASPGTPPTWGDCNPS